MSTLTYSLTAGRLTWGATHYSAVSGPHGNGPLPIGSYTVQTRRVADGSLGAGFTDSVSGNSWFIPLTPQFNTTRSGFGIHPDGNVPGTRGCIGLTGTDAQNFWLLWNRTPLASRPTQLTVTA
ncbi:MAG: L,D-transpeptidase [Pseudomonadota bacterium]